MINKEYIKQLIGKENPTILEIGCNDGEDTEGFLNTFLNVNLHCFEPDLRALDSFKKRIFDSRCKLYEIAIGNIDGEIDFNMSCGNPGGEYLKYGDWNKSGSIKKPKNHLVSAPWCKFDKTVKVKCIKLDTWVKQNNISLIDFIWADVQGAEEDLILGGLETLNQKTRYFYTEYNNHEMYENQINIDKIKDILFNFEIVDIWRDDVLLKNRRLV